MKSLVALKAVVELGCCRSWTRLHVGQPAVTKRLRALDDCYDLLLMQREGRRLVLKSNSVVLLKRPHDRAAYGKVCEFFAIR